MGGGCLLEVGKAAILDYGRGHIETNDPMSLARSTIQNHNDHSTVTHYYSVSLAHTLGDISHAIVDLARRSSENEVANGVSRDAKVGVAAQEMNALIRNDNARSRGILNGEPRLSVLSSHTSNGTRQVIASQQLDVRHLKGFHVQIIQSKQSNRVLYFKAQHEG